jgi:hypothetical protein
LREFAPPRQLNRWAAICLEKQLVRKRFLFLMTLILVICLNGCIRSNPVFRKLAEREDARRMKQTDEDVAKSPELQELDHLCTKEIPVFTGFVPNGRFASPTWKTSLHYYYRSSAAYSSVKTFYINYFSQNGWTLTRQKENSWGPDELEFARQPYRIIISHGGLGDADYALDCDKLSDSGGPLPNKSLQVSRD